MIQYIVFDLELTKYVILLKLSFQSLVYIKDKVGNSLVSKEDQFYCFIEHNEEFNSDITGYSPNENFWKGILNNFSSPREMTFGISKCATLVVKPKNFIPSKHYENPTFKFGMNYLPSTN